VGRAVEAQPVDAASITGEPRRWSGFTAIPKELCLHHPATIL
jgi:hypothetical protein